MYFFLLLNTVYTSTSSSESFVPHSVDPGVITNETVHSLRGSMRDVREFHPWAVGRVDRVSVDDQHCDSDLEE